MRILVSCEFQPSRIDLLNSRFSCGYVAVGWAMADMTLQLVTLVVVFQHKYYIWIALFSGLILPTLIAWIGWGDAMGGYVWGGLVARLLIW